MSRPAPQTAARPAPAAGPALPSARLPVRLPIRLPILAALALLLVLCAPPRAAAAGPVTPETFAAALAAAGPGDVLELAPGDYGTLRLGRRFAGAPLTIRAADPARPARFAALKLDRAEGVVIEGLVFAFRATPGEDQGRLRVSEITRSRAVTLRRCVFAGDLARGLGPRYDGYATAFGLAVRWSAGVTIEDSAFHTWFRGLVISQSEDIVLRGNDIHSIRSDGANFAEVRRVTIERNRFRDFVRAPEAGDHADMIQFWTNRTRRPSTDIAIRDNVLNSGRGLHTQSIFMRNEEVDTGRAGREMFYRNVEITGNVIVNAHLHGITVGETEGLLIAANTLVRNPASAGAGSNVALWTPSIRVKPASVRVTIRDNIVPAVSLPDPLPDGWRVEGNLMIQDRDPAQPGHYDAVFVAARTGDPRALASFAYLPEGPAARGPGAPALRLDRLAAEGALAVIRAERDPRFVNRFRFDAGLGRLPAGGGDTAVWRFDDGTEMRGRTVTRTFPAPGRHRVTLAAGGMQAEAEVVVPDPDLLRLPAGSGAFLARGRALELPDLPLERLPDGGRALRLDGTRVPAIPAAHVAGLAGARDFDLMLRFRTGAARDPSGEILRLHGTLVVSLTPTGSLRLHLSTAGAAKPAVVTTAPLRLHDGRWHEARLRYDAAAETVTVEIDGVLRARARAAGPLAAAGRRDLTFGNPFGKQSFTGLVSAFALSAGAAAFAGPSTP